LAGGEADLVTAAGFGGSGVRPGVVGLVSGREELALCDKRPDVPDELY
jgi:hypothetical protein